MLAYLNDIFLLGPPSKAMLAFDDLKSAFSNIGLEISNSKCELYCPPSTEIPASGHSHSLSVSTSGCKILGVPIGLPSFIQAHCSDFAACGSLLCTQLVNLDDPQSAMLLLRHYHVPRVTHLARSVAPATSS